MKLTQTNLSLEQTNIILYKILLTTLDFLKCKEKLLFLNNYKNINDFLELSLDDIQIKIQRNFTKRVNYSKDKLLLKAKHILNICQKKDIQLICFTDEEYPIILKEIADPPFALYCMGDVSLLKNKGVSVVGTRKITQDAKEKTLLFSKDACIEGINVISGLANGVDTYAHLGTVNTVFDFIEQEKDISILGKTIAVLPGSIDDIVPSTNKKLAAKVLQTGGLLLSEYSPLASIQKWNFVARNRIIAGLSQATVVMQSPPGSGALITADFAIDYNRDVFIHSVAFMPSSQYVSNLVKSELENKYNNGKVSEYKKNNTVESFIENGAVIINSFKDYCDALNIQKQNCTNPIQNELF